MKCQLVKNFDTGEKTTLGFKAETKRLLDIVANSLYSEKEVFCRELISNASDALEKRRYKQALNPSDESLKQLQIDIFVDPTRRVFVLQDNGIGMTKQELEEYLGTIALSGSKKFLENQNLADSKDKIIGQFGVGFYSSFMVGSKVEVYSKSAEDSEKGYYWCSEGLGDYSLSEAANVQVGTKIIIHLKPNEAKYSETETIKKIVEKYSNFVDFPVTVNGERINKIRALWSIDKNQITEKEYKEFYSFYTKAPGEPKFHLHYCTDAPINLRCLLFVPPYNSEFFGLGRSDCKMNLYSRKVLIRSKLDGLLPDWMRFLVGVIDSEDIPLNLSREMLQNNPVINKVRNTLVVRVLKWLDDIQKNDPVKYMEFYKEFSPILKEGVLGDHENRLKIARLLRFESSLSKEMISLDEYVSRTKLNEIVYLQAPSREAALQSPYYDAFKENQVEILFIYNSLDSLVLSQLESFGEKKILTAEDAGSQFTNQAKDDQLDSTKQEELIQWLMSVYGLEVKSIAPLGRISSHPAIIVDHVPDIYGNLLRMTRSDTEELNLKQPCNLQINFNHQLIKSLYKLKSADSTMAGDLADLILRNAQINAGLIADARTLVPKINLFMEKSIERYIENLQSTEIADK